MLRTDQQVQLGEGVDAGKIEINIHGCVPARGPANRWLDRFDGEDLQVAWMPPKCR